MFLSFNSTAHASFSHHEVNSLSGSGAVKCGFGPFSSLWHCDFSVFFILRWNLGCRILGLHYTQVIILPLTARKTKRNVMKWALSKPLNDLWGDGIGFPSLFLLCILSSFHQPLHLLSFILYCVDLINSFRLFFRSFFIFQSFIFLVIHYILSYGYFSSFYSSS